MSSDQFWALGLISVLIAIAFVIAYACMVFYDLSLVADDDSHVSATANMLNTANAATAQTEL